MAKSYTLWWTLRLQHFLRCKYCSVWWPSKWQRWFGRVNTCLLIESLLCSRQNSCQNSQHDFQLFFGSTSPQPLAMGLNRSLRRCSEKWMKYTTPFHILSVISQNHFTFSDTTYLKSSTTKINTCHLLLMLLSWFLLLLWL